MQNVSLRLGLSALTVGIALLVSGCVGGVPKQSGVAVSHDAGTSFTAAPDLKAKRAKAVRTYPPLAVTAVAVSPVDANEVLAGTGNDLFLSTDGGTTWKRLTTKLPVSNKAIAVSDIRWHPTSPSTFYVAGVASGYGKVFRSSDGGGSIQDVFTGAKPKQAVASLRVDPDDTVFAGDQTGSLFVSQNGGGSWQRRFSIQNPVTAVAGSGDQVYLGTLGQGIFHSTDGGRSFGAINGTQSGDALRVWTVDRAFGGIYAGSDAGLFRSADNGATWQSVGNPLPIGGSVIQAITHNNRYVFFATNAVVYRMDPGGTNFVPVQIPLAKQVWDLATTPADQSTVVAGGNATDLYSDQFQQGLPGFNLVGAPR